MVLKMIGDAIFHGIEASEMPMDVANGIDAFTIGQAMFAYRLGGPAKEKAFWHGDVRAYERRSLLVQKK